MKGHIMNYIQSFKPNGIANANGYIEFRSNTAYLDLFYYDFYRGKWELWSKHPDGNMNGIIPLDENGVSNRLWKYASVNAVIVVYSHEGTELFNYSSPSDWNDESFRASLEQFNIALRELLSSLAPTKIYASKKSDIDLTLPAYRNYIIVLNDTDSRVKVKIKNFRNEGKNLNLEPQLMLVGYIDSQGVFLEL